MKTNQKFIKDKKAISPVVGILLMTAITLIMASILTWFVFVSNVPEKSPSAIINANEATINTIKVIKLTHIGGDSVSLKRNTTNFIDTKIMVKTPNSEVFDVVVISTSPGNPKEQFFAGEEMWIYNDSGILKISDNLAVPGVGGIDISNGIYEIKFIDLKTNQVISTIKVSII